MVNDDYSVQDLCRLLINPPTAEVEEACGARGCCANANAGAITMSENGISSDEELPLKELLDD